MQISKIVLLKTNLDKDYNRVLDFNTIKIPNKLKTEMANILIDNYENIVIECDRAIKLNNKMTSIVISKLYEQVWEYNYMIIYNKYGIITPYFFFITGLISENDNNNNPSVMLSVKWDAWNNNLDNCYQISNNKVIQQSNIIDNVITTSHYERYNSETGKPIYYKSEFEEIPTKSEVALLGNRYKVLFIKLYFLENDLENVNFRYNVRINNELTVLSSNHNTPPNQLSNSKVIFYKPIALLDTLTNKYIDTEFISTSGEFNYRDKLSSSATPLNVVFPQERYMVKSNNNTFSFTIKASTSSEYLQYAELTFYCPIKYIITNNNNVLFNSIFGTIEDLGDAGNKVLSVPYEINYNNKDYGFTGGIGSAIDKVLNDERMEAFGIEMVYSKTIDINIYNDNNNIYSNLVNPLITTTNLPEPMLNKYPFDYYTLLIDNETIPLYHLDKEMDTIKLQFDLTNTQPLVFIKDGENLIYNQHGYFLKNSGIITIGSDKFIDYQLRNGSQDRTAIMLNKIGMTFNSTIGNKGVSESSYFLNASQEIFSTLANRALLEAKYQDYKNCPSTVNNTSFGEDDKIYQDRIILYHNKCFENTQYMEKLKQAFYRYGYGITKLGGVFDNNRFYFDYCKTDNCILNNITNEDDRIEIQDAFNNGITKYHINYYNNEYIFIKTLGIKYAAYNNVERNLINFFEEV